MRIARNAVMISSIPRSLVSRSRTVEALLVCAFRRSFLFDEFEKISAARPDDLALLSNYVPTTVIGSDVQTVEVGPPKPRQKYR